MNSQGNLPLLASGTAVALISVICGAVSNWEQTRYERKKGKRQTDNAETSQVELEAQSSMQATSSSKLAEAGSTKAPSNNKVLIRGIILCVCAGVLFSGWSALSTLAQKGHGCTPTNTTNCDEFDGLSPHGAMMYFSLGVGGLGFAGLPIILLVPLNPTMKPANPITAYLSLKWDEHLMLTLGGLLQSIAVAGNFIAGKLGLLSGVNEIIPLNRSYCWFCHQFCDFGRKKISCPASADLCIS
jgi:hypothetical protein